MLPTFNERGNIERILPELLAFDPGVEVVVVGGAETGDELVTGFAQRALEQAGAFVFFVLENDAAHEIGRAHV